MAQISGLSGAASSTQVCLVPSLEESMLRDPWVQTWQNICEENSWLEMRYDQSSGYCPFCTLCSKWLHGDMFDTSHIRTDRCQGRRARSGITCGPKLARLLAATHQGTDVSQTVGYFPAGTSDRPGTVPPSTLAAAVSEALVPAASTLTTSLVPSSGMRCRTPDCNYLAHSDEDFEGFCCRMCQRRFKGDIWRRADHGHRCQRIEAPVGAPSQAPARTAAAAASSLGGAADIARFAVVAPQVTVCEGAEVHSPEIGVLQQDEQCLVVRSILRIGEERIVLRARVQTDALRGWVTLAEQRSGVERFESSFREPPVGWAAISASAVSA